MLARFGLAVTELFRKILPDAFIIAIALSIIVLILGIVIGNSPIEMALLWGGGVWNLLTFMAQASLTILLGFTVVRSNVGAKIVDVFAGLPKNKYQAVIVVATVTYILYYLNWGVGMVAGCLLARRIGVLSHQKGIPIHYPLLGAAVYTSQFFYQAGFSGAVALFIATPGHVLEDIMGVIPISQTLLMPQTLAIAIGLFIMLPIILALSNPSDDKVKTGADFIPQDELEGKTIKSPEIKSEEKQAMTFSELLNSSRVINLFLMLVALTYLVITFAEQGTDAVNLNNVNLILLTIALLAHKKPIDLVNTFKDATSAASGILLQFPIYAGIMGMVVGSGLVSIIAGFFINISTETTYPFFTFLSAGLLNIFTPSGGGQWAVQGPIVVEAAAAIGVDYGRAAMAVGWGDVWTNMIQPFWLLPIVGMMGGEARDYLSYTAVTLIFSGIWISIMLMLL